MSRGKEWRKEWGKKMRREARCNHPLLDVNQNIKESADATAHYRETSSFPFPRMLLRLLLLLDEEEDVSLFLSLYTCTSISLPS